MGSLKELLHLLCSSNCEVNIYRALFILGSLQNFEGNTLHAQIIKLYKIVISGVKKLSLFSLEKLPCPVFQFA